MSRTLLLLALAGACSPLYAAPATTPKHSAPRPRRTVPPPPATGPQAPRLDEVRLQNFTRWTNEAEAKRHREMMAAERRPAPGSGLEVEVPITGQAMGSDGKLYTFSAVVRLEVQESGAQSLIERVTNGEGLSVSAGTAGAPLTVSGTALAAPGVAVRLRIGTRPVELLAITPAALTFRGDPTPAAPLVLEWLQGGRWVERARLPSFAIIDALPPPADQSLRWESFHHLDGTPARTLLVGEPFIIRGRGFGNTPGGVLINFFPWPHRRWSDTEIEVEGWSGANRHHTITLGVRRAEGGYAISWSRGDNSPYVLLPGDSPVPAQ